MKLKKIENPWELSLEELQKRCVEVKTADGVMRDVGFDCDGKDITASVYANPGMIEVRRCGWHLLGWTFYEEVKPLVWEGECLSMDSRTGFLVFTEAAFLPPGYERRKFRVVATEIVGVEDAKA